MAGKVVSAISCEALGSIVENNNAWIVLGYHALLSGRGCPGYTAVTVTVLSASKDFYFCSCGGYQW